jgi:hypothetical protein
VFIGDDDVFQFQLVPIGPDQQLRAVTLSWPAL